jgi:hypothetical protein
MQKNELRVHELDHMVHDVTGLLRYHCQYSAAELIWAEIKDEVDRNNTFEIASMEQ